MHQNQTERCHAHFNPMKLSVAKWILHIYIYIFLPIIATLPCPRGWKSLHHKTERGPPVLKAKEKVFSNSSQFEWDEGVLGRVGWSVGHYDSNKYIDPRLSATWIKLSE